MTLTLEPPRELGHELAGQWPTYGYRRITAELKRAGWMVNHKRVARPTTEMGLPVKVKRAGKRTTNSDHDQGVQYAATDYLNQLHVAQVAVSMADVGAAWQNGYAERLMRAIKEEEVYLSEYVDYHDALRQLGRLLNTQT